LDGAVEIGEVDVGDRVIEVEDVVEESTVEHFS
jgi:hypothetical protein